MFFGKTIRWLVLVVWDAIKDFFGAKKKKKKMRKKAIELSVNFIVILILSVVIFGGGLTFFMRLYGEAEEMKVNLDSQTEAQIEAMFDSGQRVAIPINKRDTKSGDLAVFGVGILNTFRVDTNFVVEARCDTAYEIYGDKNYICEDTNCLAHDCNSWLLYNPQPFELKPNEQFKFSLGIAPKQAPPGEYIYNICVCENECVENNLIKKGCVKGGISTDNLYDRTVHKIRIRIP